ncbi:MAG: hypothetical protein IJO29_08850 [Oscillospiraceae bacterium]|nr:hypothetical protein [Oscillospiraceae bacterium]
MLDDIIEFIAEMIGDELMDTAMDRKKPKGRRIAATLLVGIPLLALMIYCFVRLGAKGQTGAMIFVGVLIAITVIVMSCVIMSLLRK